MVQLHIRGLQNSDYMEPKYLELKIDSFIFK